MTMSEFSFEFDAVEIKIDDTTFWASGSVDVGYSTSRPERSTGWSGGVEVESFGEMVVTVSLEDGDEAGPFFFRKGHPVFEAIIDACDADIVDAAKDDCRWD
jgi:hypothetical protein